MATPRKATKKRVKDAGTREDPIKRMIGQPEPTLQYLEGALGRLATPGVVLVVVVVLALYFKYGP